MNAHISQTIPLLLSTLLFLPLFASAQQPHRIALVKPETTGGRPLMEVLKERHSTRSFSDEPLPDQVLSNVLWAAFGINRPDTGKRTAPSAMNIQETDIYVATAHGLYLYNAKAHALDLVLPGDIRAETGRQDYVKDAAVNLIYVADFSKMQRYNEDDRIFYSAANVGFIAQNVYLYCTSAGLGTVVRGAVDRPALSKTMKLRPEQKVILAQTVGYPKKEVTDVP